MAVSSNASRRSLTVPIVCGVLGLLVLVLAGVFLSRPASKPAPAEATTAAKAYLVYLGLSDVSMQASENFMKQQVVEVKGNIANNGPKTLRAIEVYCIFSDPNGREIHRERAFIVSSKEAPLRPGEKRAFRLPFDSLPDGWNQAMPRLVVAQIQFAK